MASSSKSYKEYHRRLLFIETDRKKFFTELSRAISLSETEKVNILLNILKKEGQTSYLAKYRENSGESMLHVAAKFNQSSEIIEKLIKICPELVTTARKESEDYFGQTALHIAIAKGNIEAVETMLSEILNHSQSLKSALLHQVATGIKFANTIMMGELPLSVAASTFNSDMVYLLLQNGAEIERKNTKGDTVFHTLIRFAAIYPEFTTNVIQCLDYFREHIEEKAGKDMLSIEYDHSDCSYIWFVPNNDDLNPLQLAATLSQPSIFQYILNLPKVYCFLDSHDGLFDRKLFDITEIDTVAMEAWAGHEKFRRNRMQRHVAPTTADGVSRRKFSNKTSCFSMDICQRDSRKSVLEMMFDIKSSAAFEFIQQSTMRQVIKSKWMYYRWYYYIWMVFHILFMITLTVYSVNKADDYDTGNATVDKQDNAARGSFLDGFSYIFLIIGSLYFLHEIIHLLFRVKSFELAQFFNVLHNGSYRAILVLFSLSLILEFILSRSMSDYENYTLIMALITGWWFVVFFLRAQKKFSFFTVMIQKVIFGDMLRFSIIISLTLIAFTAGIYMAFKGSQVDETENLHSYASTMMLLFKLMLGLGDIETLYEARRPWLAITLFIVFVLLTYVLMFNALIAMMSQTCTLVSENRHVQWRVQQLSVILFFEGILPICMKKMVGKKKYVKRFDSNIKQVVDEKRYFLDMSSIQTQYANAEDIFAMKKQLQTLPFGDQRTFYPNFNLTQNLQSQQFLMINPGHHPRVSVRSPKADNSYVYPRTSTSPADRYEHQQEHPLKRKKSKRDKSPPKTPSGINPSFIDYVSDSAAEVQPSARPMKQNRRKQKKKRIEPEGDINTSYDDQSPRKNEFYHNQHHLTVPNLVSVSPQNAAVHERRRYNSENNGFVDTYIGEAQPMQQLPQPHTKMPVPMPVEPMHQIAPNNALDIGVISDSYM